MIDVIPVPGFSAPAVCISAFSLLINKLPVMKDLTIFAPMALIRGDKSNRTVPMDIVIPINKLGYPLTGVLDRFKSKFRIVRPIFARSKKRFRIRVVIADSRPAERSHNPKRFEFGIERRAFLGRTIVRMKHKRLERTTLCQNSLVNETGRITGTFPVKHLPPNNFSAEHVHNHIKVKEHTPDGTGHPRNIPAPDLVRPGCTKPLRWHVFSRLPATTPMVLLVSFVKDPVKTRLRGNISALVGQSGHNLRGWQACIFLLMAYIQNALSFLWRQLVGWSGS
jgi:hypothetical protein